MERTVSGETVEQTVWWRGTSGRFAEQGPVDGPPAALVPRRKEPPLPVRRSRSARPIPAAELLCGEGICMKTDPASSAIRSSSSGAWLNSDAQMLVTAMRSGWSIRGDARRLMQGQARLGQDGEQHETRDPTPIRSKDPRLPAHHRKAYQGSKGAVGGWWRCRLGSPTDQTNAGSGRRLLRMPVMASA